jgi:hypothetical protein
MAFWIVAIVSSILALETHSAEIADAIARFLPA